MAKGVKINFYPIKNNSKSESEDTISQLSEGLDDLGIFDFRQQINPRRSSTLSSKESAKAKFKLHTESEDDHHTRLGEHAATLWKSNKMTDVTVKLRGIDYPAHKTVLSCYSKYFRDMLLESEKSMSSINLKLESVSNEAFSALLRYMYTGNLNLSVQNIGDVYTASRKLGMPGALHLCTKILTGKRRHNVHSVFVYVTAQRLGLEEAAKRALQTMCKRFEQVVGTPEFLDLNYAQVIEYLSADSLATRSEVIVYLGALKWISVRFLEREQFSVDVIGCVRFPMMSMNEILACHSPPLLPGIVEMPEVSHMLLKGTCYVAAKAINEEKRFVRYACPERTYLLEREAIILWDPNIFDPERYALYAKEVAATTIQAGFRGLQARRSIHKERSAANVIQKAFRRYSHIRHDPLKSEKTDSHFDSDSDHERRDSEDSPSSDDQEKHPFSERMRKSVSSFFGLISPENTMKGHGSKHSDSPKHVKANKSKHQELQKLESSSSDDSTPSVTSSLDDLARHVNRTTEELEDKRNADMQTPSDTASNKYKQPKSIPKRTSPDRVSAADAPSISRGISKSTSPEGSVQRVPDPEKTDCIVLTGGFFANNVDDPRSGLMLLLYDPAENTWSKLGEMPKPRHHHRAVYTNGFIYCIGGCDPRKTRSGSMVPLRTCYGLDLRTMKWRELAKMRNCRMYHSVAELNGKIYVVSGQDDHDRIVDSVEVYDPDTDSWSVLSDTLDTPTMGAGVCAHGGRLWIIGGMGQDSHGRINVVGDVVCYDPKKGEFVHKIPNLPHPRAFAESVEYGKYVFAIGGTTYSDSDVFSDNLTSTEDVVYYDERKRKWRSFPSLPTPRHFVAPVSVGMSLFVIGGLTSYERIALEDVLLFNETSGQWHQCASMPYPICGFAAVSVPRAT